MKNALSILLIFFFSCSHFEQAKTLYFSNQLTPTINTSLTLVSAYLNCLKDEKATLRPTDQITFSVIGGETTFTIKEITFPASLAMTCSEKVKSTYSEIPYINKLTRWIDRDKNEFTTDEKHGYLYNFRQLYQGALYQIQLVSLAPTEAIIAIKRTGHNQSHISKISESTYHEQFQFKTGIENNKKIDLIYPWPKENLSLVW